MSVFISYSSQDVDFAKALKHALSKTGESVLSDQELPAGEDWDSGIQRALREANVVILLVTPESLSSKIVNYEIGSAIGAGTPVLPVLLREVAPLPKYLQQVQAIDARGLDSTTIGRKVAAAIIQIKESR
jgi:hypothetical protein